MSEKFNRSPNGYTYLTGEQKLPRSGSILFHGIREADPDVVALWADYNKRVTTEPTVKLIMRAVRIAKAKWGSNFHRWVSVELTANPDIKSHRVDFLGDIVRKSQGETPKFGLVTWSTLIKMVSDVDNESTEAKIERLSNVAPVKETNQLLKGILQQKDGGDYLIQVLNLLFGK